MSVQVTQFRQGTGQVVQVAHRFGQRGGHLRAVALDLGGAVAQVVPSAHPYDVLELAQGLGPQGCASSSILENFPFLSFRP